MAFLTRAVVLSVGLGAMISACSDDDGACSSCSGADGGTGGSSAADASPDEADGSPTGTGGDAALPPTGSGGDGGASITPEAAPPPTGSGWQVVSSGSTVYHRVGFCNGKFFLLGTSSVTTTTDGSLGTPVKIGQGIKLDQFACGPSAVLVLGKQDTSPYSGHVFRSTDGGQSFTEVTPAEVGVGGLETAAYLEGKFIVGGMPGTVFTSTDGASFSATPATRKIGTTNLGGMTVSRIAFGNGTYVAAQGGETYTSTDLAEWTYREQLGPLSPSSLAFYNGSFIAVGEQKSIFLSTDGVTWTASNVPNSVVVSADFYDVVFAEGLYTAVGNSATLISSTDAITWTSEQDLTQLQVQNLYGVAYGNGIRLAAGSIGVVLVHR